MTVGCFN